MIRMEPLQLFQMEIRFNGSRKNKTRCELCSCLVLVKMKDFVVNNLPLAIIDWLVAGDDES